MIRQRQTETRLYVQKKREGRLFFLRTAKKFDCSSMDNVVASETEVSALTKTEVLEAHIDKSSSTSHDSDF